MDLVINGVDTIMPGFVEKVPATPPLVGAAILRGFNILNASLKAQGLGLHNAYVDAAFLKQYNSDPQVLDPGALSFENVTTTAQARLVANALKPLIKAHLLDKAFAHLAIDSTSPAITAPLADANGVGNTTQIGTGNAGLLYTPSVAGVTVRHAGGITQSLSTSVTGQAITVNLAGVGSGVNLGGGGNAGVTLTANQTGVTARLVNPGANAASEVVSVVAKAITVTLRYANGAPTSTADQVRAAIAGSVAAMALLTSVANTGDGSGTSSAVGCTTLTWAQTSTAEDVRAAVAGSVAAMALLSAVANAGDGTGTVAVASATALNGNNAARTLLNQEKATLNSHYARQPEHNPLPASPVQISAADATDDSSAITLADALMQTYIAHVLNVALTYQADPQSP